MTMRLDNPFLRKLRMSTPIIQAPMTGYVTEEMVIAVSNAGGLGSLAGSLFSPETIIESAARVRKQTAGPIAINFLAHQSVKVNPDRDAIWRTRLASFFEELGIAHGETSQIMPVPVFGDEQCMALEEARPDVVSFHLGLPDEEFIARLKKTGAMILSSATTVTEALWLEERGCDAIIAQGLEAGGHRGSFLSRDLAEQCGTMTLVPQILDAVRVPVIAAGGIGDARGVQAALRLGASAVQIGTAFLFCPEARVPAPYREALFNARGADTVVTSIYSGRPARVIANRFTRTLEKFRNDVVDFPFGMAAIAPLIGESLKRGSREIGPFWAGEAVGSGKPRSAGELVAHLSAEDPVQPSPLALQPNVS